MTEPELKKMLDTAELLGFQRGMLTMIKYILDQCDKSGYSSVSYKVIKDIYMQLMAEKNETTNTI